MLILALAPLIGTDPSNNTLPEKCEPHVVYEAQHKDRNLEIWTMLAKLFGGYNELHDRFPTHPVYCAGRTCAHGVGVASGLLRLD